MTSAIILSALPDGQAEDEIMRMVVKLWIEKGMGTL